MQIFQSELLKKAVQALSGNGLKHGKLSIPNTLCGFQHWNATNSDTENPNHFLYLINYVGSSTCAGRPTHKKDAQVFCAFACTC